MSTDRFSYLLQQYMQDALTPVEKSELANYLNETTQKEQLIDRLQNMIGSIDQPAWNGERLNEMVQQVLHSDRIGHATPTFRPVHRIHLLRTAWFQYAAAILIILGMGTWLWNKNTSSSAKVEGNVALANVDLTPGGNRAILTLADGSTITLDSAANGELTQQGNTTVIKKNDQIIYGDANPFSGEARGNHPLLGGASSRSEEGVGIPSWEGPLREAKKGVGFAPETFNTLTTPRGGQYQLVLPDGSRVWLNSASSLKYPVVFNSAKREVELTGEGYFEIKENKSMPFIVRTRKLDVTVLGTAFNINAYEDEPIVAATLVHGLIKVFNKTRSVLIKPGQQASITGDDSALKTSTPNMSTVLAWKEGRFQFDGARIQGIMRQISRWYNVEIIYKGVMPETEFSGSLLRTENPSSLLNALTLTDKVHFIIEKNIITVIPGAKPKQ